MFEFYEKSICNKTETSMPFKTFIDDICNKKTKKLNIFSIPIKEVKERAYTYTPKNNVPLENWRNKKSFDSTIINNNNNNSNYNNNIYKNLQKNKINEYNNNNNKKIQMNN
jgi:hypothetical protein